ncbi:hypothetical protein M405DRAFT_141282 [Rhizopogon salebrosus TDB-379]|nr:hypothetical protein M405DRAFT_141282 [Rhizopogon salebrosus TDB-379]
MSAGVRCHRCPDVRPAETCGGKIFEMRSSGWVVEIRAGSSGSREDMRTMSKSSCDLLICDATHQ